MSADKTGSKQRMGAMELVASGGFALFLGWMLCSFYWMFTVFPPGFSEGARNFAQAFIFFGIFVAYLILHFYARKMDVHTFSRPLLIVCTILLCILPTAWLISLFGVEIPFFAACIGCCLTGLAAGYLTVSWLDVAGSIRIHSYHGFTSLSFAGGAVFFLLVSCIPQFMQPIFIIVYALLSGGLVNFVSTRAKNNEDSEKHLLNPRVEVYTFAKEVEPAIFVYGIVFGLNFVFLFGHGQQAVLFGLGSVLIGGIAVFIADFFGKNVSITVIQRILLCVTVAACLVMPFAAEWLQTVCSCAVIAGWAAFVSTNYALLTRKSVEKHVSVFSHAPVGLSITAAGFFIGWLLATCLLAFAVDTSIITAVLLAMAFILVAVIMFFFPASHHHDEKAAEMETGSSSSIVPPGVSEKAVFDARCEAIAKMYQLSPRESDILEFLAKGRNASYIQGKLTISSHTVKSHIYSIYRKLDIHSQQKLMDFVEEYPIDMSVYTAEREGKKS